MGNDLEIMKRLKYQNKHWLMTMSLYIFSEGTIVKVTLVIFVACFFERGVP